ncbi:ArsR family transcriptional regulator [Micromonospora sp. Llam0]|nr:ArsR family transcriptional regulator [Micromonospora sp. Llam0]
MVIEAITGPETEQLDLVTVLSALADPVRLAYVQAIANARSWVPCGEVLKGSDITVGRSTLSHHLRVLREAGLTTTRVEGTRRFVSLRRDDLDARFPGLLDAVSAAPTPAKR